MFHKIPKDILLLIAEYLNFTDLRSLKNTCELFQQILKNSKVWEKVKYVFSASATLHKLIKFLQVSFDLELLQNINYLDEFRKQMFINFIKNRKCLHISEFETHCYYVYRDLFKQYGNEFIKINPTLFSWKRTKRIIADKQFEDILQLLYLNATEISYLDFNICNKKYRAHFTMEINTIKIYFDLTNKTEEYEYCKTNEIRSSFAHIANHFRINPIRFASFINNMYIHLTFCQSDVWWDGKIAKNKKHFIEISNIKNIFNFFTIYKMPLHDRSDSNGSYWIWGDHGHKYYYDPKSVRSNTMARNKAAKQGRAIEFSKHSKSGGKKSGRKKSSKKKSGKKKS
jgi:hypothetical protein